jgi:hypothetical protein
MQAITETIRGCMEPAFDAQEDANFRAGRRGFILRRGLSAHYAGCLRVTDDRAGLEFCGEEPCPLDGGVNFILVNARAAVPNFGLKGSLLGNGKYWVGTWLVKINDRGLAEETRCGAWRLWRHDKKAYARHLGNRLWWSTPRPIHEGFVRHHRILNGDEPDMRGALRKAADSVCYGIVDAKTRLDTKLFNWRHRKDWLENGP